MDTKVEGLKFVVVGRSGAGKSCLLLRFVDNVFNASFATTIGIDFKIKTLELPSSGKNKNKVKIQIWDTGGQERFGTITKAYYRSAEAVILVYDITDKQSFNELGRWVDEIDMHTRNDPIRILVGNKCDMTELRQTSKEEGQQFAEPRGFQFFETSSLTGENVHEMFLNVAQQVYEIKKRGESVKEIPTEIINLTEPPEVKKKECC